MRFSLLATQKNFFHTKGYIQFERLLSSKVCASLRGVKPGRDLFRSSDTVRKIVVGRNMGDLARNLVDCKELRVGFDEIACAPFWFEGKTLAQCTSVRGLKVAFLIALDGDLSGSGIAFSPELAWHGQETELACPGPFLLIAYATPAANYVLEPNDPHTHALKHLGLVYGEPLSEKTHPLLR
jgi:hypothetical protein